VFPDPAEFAARNADDIVWLQQTFAEAKQRGSAAVMLISQADPGFDTTDGTRGPVRNPNTLAETDGQPDGFVQFLLALRAEVVAFGKLLSAANRSGQPCRRPGSLTPRKNQSY